jgi:integrase
MARQRYQRGCVFQRGKRRKVWVGRWRERVLQVDGMIGQVQRSVVLGRVADLPTRRLAQAALDERVGPINRGLHVPQSVATFCEFADRDWKRLVLPTLKLSTQRSYRMMLHKHLVPYWREWRLCDITKLDVQQFVLRKFDQQLAWQTVRNAWIVLSSILDAAMEYGALAVNPARGVKFPLAPPRTAPRILGHEDVGALLQQVEEPHRTMIGLVALTGLRIGELLALRWRGLDLTTGTLRVLESVFEGQRQRPKTQRALRTIPLGPHAVQVLTDHRERSRRTAADDLVFPNRAGEPLRESKLLTRVLQPAAERAGLGRVTWHQFRHVHSSLLNDLGVPVKIAQEQLGHASVQTTLNIYTHVVEGSHRLAIEQLEARLFPSVPKS